MDTAIDTQEYNYRGNRDSNTQPNYTRCTTTTITATAATIRIPVASAVAVTATGVTTTAVTTSAQEDVWKDCCEAKRCQYMIRSLVSYIIKKNKVGILRFGCFGAGLPGRHGFHG